MLIQNARRHPVAMLCGFTESLRRCVALGFALLLGLAGVSAKPGKPTAALPMPAAVVGKWIYGTFSPANFWGKDGRVSGAAYEQSMAFQFRADGTYDMYVINTTNYYGCRTAAYSLYKGTAVVNEAGQSLVLTPAEGTQRGEFSCVPAKNFKRPASDRELTGSRRTVYYTIDTDANRQSALNLRFGSADAKPMRLTPGNW